MKKRRTKLKFIDLFAGIGGFRIALEELGHKCVFSSDIDEEARKTYRKNFGEFPEGDITEIPVSAIPDHDILCAGFPCQPFSISGKQGGFKDTRGTLFYNIAKIAEKHRPSILFLENVANMARHDKGKTLRTIIKSLKEIDYSVYYDVLNASEFGVPQARKRLYFICVEKEIKKNGFMFPQGNKENIFLKNIISFNTKKVEECIVKRSDVVMYPDKIKQIKHIQGTSKCLRPLQIGIVNKGGQGERIYSIDGHAITLSAYGGGAGAKTGLYKIGRMIRKLHPQECKLVMGFPRRFKPHSKRHEAYKQFGNSVVVKVVKEIFESAQQQILN